MGRDSPAPEPDASGRLLLRLPRSLHQSLIDRAARENVSVNQLFVNLLAERAAASPIKPKGWSKIVRKPPAKAFTSRLRRKRA